MTARLPKVLRQKRALLAFERVQLAKRAAEVDAELAALDLALVTFDPAWQPPTKVSKPCKATLLPRGAVSQGALAALRAQPVLWTGEIATLLARQYKVEFLDKRSEQDFASSVAMALRRYERRGVVEVVEQAAGTGALRWRLRRTADGRLLVGDARKLRLVSEVSIQEVKNFR